MFQIRIHGRGGQGVVTAAELIAIAAFNDGKQAQAFPSFGVERTGAPIEAYARIDDKPIRTREHVYKPNVLIIQDSTLLETVDVAHGCDKNTLVIINTAKTKSEIKQQGVNLPEKNIYSAPVKQSSKKNKNFSERNYEKLLKRCGVYPIDATKIALEIIGKNLVNTVILGAFAKVAGLVSLSSLEKAIKQKFGEKGGEIVDKNIKAIKKAFGATLIRE
ncbi:2-oxoacid:acceptor oxidoreductase family protein [Patescibacteria group bacterium]|nr:pyruvate ferredoxin oxidoreductase [Candidatus Falkowbacteria bacterium]MBU3906228.1 2-oxoacid:acceptor oxidoreductase family protein [Patescibacteria group bacterium]MCG2698715.1 2-oxoacid:acceptor oxidoreductase family protein [Candidatus Parcubacteria bacterium]MBU4014933.1 2-oxoacid:acceptor oxidoreductase family protein [Patescibacteria group bacterium]MBU4026857.1 2-oxoacid:acceptor oxidoreductase family protein [Patescibacteria group bacterium]